MRILLSGLLLFFVTHNSIGMLDNHSGTNVKLNLVATVSAALLVVKTALPQNAVFGIIPCTPVGIGVQVAQLGVQCAFDYYRYNGDNYMYEKCSAKYTKERDKSTLRNFQNKYNKNTRNFLLECKTVEVVVLLLIHGVALAYNGRFTSGKHWKGVGKHFLMTQIWSLVPLYVAWRRACG